MDKETQDVVARIKCKVISDCSVVALDCFKNGKEIEGLARCATMILAVDDLKFAFPDILGKPMTDHQRESLIERFEKRLPPSLFGWE